MPPRTSVERLVGFLFEGDATHPLAMEVAAWLAGSGRFRAFAEAHRDKIRRKLRGATDTEARRDVRAELRVAHLLLADRQLELGFEAYGSGNVGPDFTVTFRGAPGFNLEVKRLRRTPDGPRLQTALLAKLRQLPPGTANVVLVAIESGGAASVDVGDAARALRGRADAKDEAYFAGRGFEGTRAFYQRYLRLGGVIVWSESASGDARAAIWINPSARIALPERAARACLRCLRPDQDR